MFGITDWSQWLTTSVVGLILLAVVAAFLYDVLKLVAVGITTLLKKIFGRIFQAISTRVMIGLVGYFFRPMSTGFLVADGFLKRNDSTGIIIYSMFMCTKLLSEIAVFCVFLNLIIYYVIIQGQHNFVAAALIFSSFFILNIIFRDMLTVNGAMKPSFGPEVDKIREKTKTFESTLKTFVDAVKSRAEVTETEEPPC